MIAFSRSFTRVPSCSSRLAINGRPKKHDPICGAKDFAAGYSISVLILGLLAKRVAAESAVLALSARVAVGLFLVLTAVRLWRRAGASIKPAAIVTPAEVFMTTLLNSKWIIFGFAIIPFGAAQVWSYFGTFLAIVICIALCWIMVGASIELLMSRRGPVALVPRIGALVIGGFALRLLAVPLRS